MDIKKIKKYFIYIARFFGGILFYTLILYVVTTIYNVVTFTINTPLVIDLPLIIVLTLITYVFILYKKWKKNRVKFYISLFSMVTALTLIILIISASIQPQRPGNSHDGRRAADILYMKVAFNHYYDENREYPMAGVDCQNMDLLEGIFTPYVPEVPQERFISEGHPPYQYSVSADGEQFVIKATFDKYRPQFDQRYLGVDLDGNILGCDCDDPHYCVGSSNL